MAEKKKRDHKASFCKDKRHGGYNIWVAGPMANRFAGREVPVTMSNGDEKMITLKDVQWTGQDPKTGEFAAVYDFQPEERIHDDIPF